MTSSSSPPAPAARSSTSTKRSWITDAPGGSTGAETGRQAGGLPAPVLMVGVLTLLQRRFGVENPVVPVTDHQLAAGRLLGPDAAADDLGAGAVVPQEAAAAVGAVVAESQRPHYFLGGVEHRQAPSFGYVVVRPAVAQAGDELLLGVEDGNSASLRRRADPRQQLSGRVEEDHAAAV